MVLAFCLGCKRDHHAKNSTIDLTEVSKKKEVYCNLARDKYRQRGWVGTSECDSLLFTALYGVACGGVDIEAFEESPGYWRRNPDHTCGPDDGSSASTISRDMFLGVFHQLWDSKDKDAVARIEQYGKDHDWVMGDGDKTRTVFTPGLITDVYDMLDKLSLSVEIKESSEDSIAAINKGFQAHLDILHILLHGRVYKGINAIELSTLKGQAQRQPRNALYRAAYALFSDGNQQAAAEMIMNETFFPADRLPTNAQYCTEYLFQRDDAPQDWAPCSDKQEHDGVDLVFAVTVMEGFNGAKQ